MGCSGYGACPLFVAIWENTRKLRPVINCRGALQTNPDDQVWFGKTLMQDWCSNMFSHVCLSCFFSKVLAEIGSSLQCWRGSDSTLKITKKKLEENATNIKQSPKIQLFGCPPRPFFMGGLMSTPADAMAFVTEATTPGWQWMNGQRGWSGVDMGTARWDLPSGNFMGFNGI